MDLKSLRYFAEVARQKSFTVAAERLFVTQPTLSRQIADLEDELGQRLFERTTRRLELTEKGLYLYRQAQTILALVDKTKLETMSNAGLTGDITIAGAEISMIRTVVEAAAEFQARHPNVRFHLKSTSFPDTQEALSLGIADFGVFMLPTKLDGVEMVELPGSARWGVLVRRDGIFAGRTSVRPADLRDLPLYVPGSRLYESRFSGWLGYPFDSLNIAGTYTLLYNASFLACAGAGVLCIDGIVEPKPAETFLPLDPPMPARAAVAWFEARPKKMLTEAFIALLRQRIAAAAPDGSETTV